MLRVVTDDGSRAEMRWALDEIVLERNNAEPADPQVLTIPRPLRPVSSSWLFGSDRLRDDGELQAWGFQDDDLTGVTWGPNICPAGHDVATGCACNLVE